MEFINPSLLWGLVGIAIPIAIHLLQLKRYKTILFSDLRFLKSVQKSARKQQKIRHWIILMTRIIAWGLLTLAFAMPFLPHSDNYTQRQSIAIYIDNSPSMTQKGEESPLWVQAKESARSIVSANPQSDFLILTPDMEYAGQIKNAAAANLAIDEIRPTSASSGWNQLIQSLSTFNREDTVQVFVLSDAQSTSVAGLDTSELKLELFPIVYQPVEATKNVSIDTAFLKSPVLVQGQNVEVEFELKNYSNEESDVPVELWVNGEWSGVQNILLAPGSSAKSTFAFQADTESNLIEVRLEDGAQDFDNIYRLSSQAVAGKRIAHLYSPGYAQLNLDSVIRDSAYSIDQFSYSQVPYGQLTQYDFILADLSPDRMIPGLSQALADAVESGTSLLIFPGYTTSVDDATIGIASISNVNSDTIDNLQLNADDAFFKGLFYETPRRIKLPAIFNYSSVSESEYLSLGGTSLIQSPSGMPSLIRYPKGLGQVYFWNAHPIRSQIGRTELYTAMIYQMIIFKESAPNFAAEIGTTSSLRVVRSSEGDEPIVVIQDSIEVIPRQSSTGSSIEFSLETLLFSPGFAVITQAGDTIGTLALNTSSTESDLDVLSESELDALLTELNYIHRINTVANSTSALNYLENLNQNKQDSRWWIIAALIVLILEMVLWRQPKS
ncbi:MAG: BatA domain-containing protein [Flavobacteriia bacterium]|nr:BatA domain-containing protein [Flavobacteriia bacterium]